MIKVILPKIDMLQALINNCQLPKPLFGILKANFEIMIFLTYFQVFFIEANLQVHMIINQHVKFGCNSSNFL